jgi:hypothetical protein
LVSKKASLAKSVEVTSDGVFVVLSDGTRVAIEPTPRLRSGTAADLERWNLGARGTLVHWPRLDEDLAVAHLLGLEEAELFDLAGVPRYEERRGRLLPPLRARGQIEDMPAVATRANAVKHEVAEGRRPIGNAVARGVSPGFASGALNLLRLSLNFWADEATPIASSGEVTVEPAG